MKAAVCVYVRDEERNIQEWIIYHQIIGFDTIILMDNLSVDRTQSNARLCIKHYDIRFEDWADTSPFAQRNCYNYVLEKYGSEFAWIAFIDSDEFIVPTQNSSVRPMLELNFGHAAIGLNWLIFGSSNHRLSPPSLVLEAYCHRAPKDFPPNRHIKSIVQPSLTFSCAHPHLFHVKGERWDESGQYRSDYVDPAGNAIVWGNEPGLTSSFHDELTCRVHHYFTRSREDWNRKLQRRWRDIERSDADFDFHNRNEIRDETALRFVPELKIQMERLNALSLTFERE